MHRLGISVRLVCPFLVIASLAQIPGRASSSLRRLRGSCAVLASTISADSEHIRKDCERFAPRDAELEMAGEVWDPALRSWMFFVRCARPGECIPFWLRVPDPLENLQVMHAAARRNQPAPGSSKASPISSAAAKGVAPQPLVRPGQKTTLLWEQNGIRLEAQAICLDKGARGDRVRARVSAGKIVRAVVISHELLKVES